MTEKNTRHFTEEELRDYVYGFAVHEEGLGKRRWSETMVTVFQAPDDEKYYQVEWEQGLTENQENEFYNQPVEVFPVRKVDASDRIVYVENPNENLSLTLNSEDIAGTALIVDNADTAINALKEYNVDNVLDFLNTIEPVFLDDKSAAFHAASKDFFKALNELKKNM